MRPVRTLSRLFCGVLSTFSISIIGLIGCGGDVASPFDTKDGEDAAKLFWALTVNYSRVTLSTVPPYDTIQLIITPRDAQGNAIQGLSAPQFEIDDPNILEVTPDGKVKAKQSGAARILITVKGDNMEREANVEFLVTDEANPPTLSVFSIRPPEGDSTIWAIGGDGSTLNIAADGTYLVSAYKGVFGTATDSSGTPIPGIAMQLESSDSSIAVVPLTFESIWALQPIKPGRVTFTGHARAYNITKNDTVTFTITHPVFAVVPIRLRQLQLGQPQQIVFESNDITIRPGGTIIWVNTTGNPVDIIFDDTTNIVEHGVPSCGFEDVGGRANVDAFGIPPNPADYNVSPQNCRSRRFPVAGVYKYRSTKTESTGQIVVSDVLPTP